MPKLLDLDSLVLLSGAHRSRSEGVCLLEAAAWLAGKPHSDHPPCVSPILGAYGRAFNDRLNDERRQQLKPFIPRLLNTADDGKEDRRRVILWEFTSARLCMWLREAGMEAEARRIETDGRSAVYAVREATWKAREAARARMAAAIRAELAKRPVAAAAADAAAVAAADAAAAAAAAAVADAAAAAVADAAADAAAVAAAVAVAVAVADAAAAAAAAAAADAVADAVAVADADRWNHVWRAAYDAARPIFDAKYASLREEFATDGGFELFDRLVTAAPA